MSLINDALKRAREQQQHRHKSAPAGLPLQPVEAPSGGFPAKLLYGGLLVVTLGLGGGFLWQWFKTPSEAPPAPAASGVATTPRRGEPSARLPADEPLAVVTPQVHRPVVQVSTALVSRSGVPIASQPARVVAPAVPAVPAVGAAAPGRAIAAPAMVEPVAPAVAAASPPSQPVVASTSVPVAAAAPEVSSPAVPVASGASGASGGVATASAFPELKLQSIFYRLKRPSVQINGKDLYVGDSVGEVKILSIERDRVTVGWRGETKVMVLR